MYHLRPCSSFRRVLALQLGHRFAERLDVRPVRLDLFLEPRDHRVQLALEVLLVAELGQ